MIISTEAINFINSRYEQNKCLLIVAFEALTRGCCYIIKKPSIFLITIAEFKIEISNKESGWMITDFEIQSIPNLNIPIYWHNTIKNAWNTAEIDLTPESELILFLHDNLDD